MGQRIEIKLSKIKTDLVTFLCIAATAAIIAPVHASMPDSVRGGVDMDVQTDGSNWTKPNREVAPRATPTASSPAAPAGRPRLCKMDISIAQGKQSGECVVEMWHVTDNTQRCSILIGRNGTAQLSFFFKEEYAQLDLSLVDQAQKNLFRETQTKRSSEQTCATNPRYYIPYMEGKTVALRCTDGKLHATRVWGLTDAFPAGSCEIDRATGLPKSAQKIPVANPAPTPAE